MGTNWTEPVEFDCGSDHSLTEPCKGHRLRLGFHRGSDTVTIEVDGEYNYVMSDGEYAAFCKAAEVGAAKVVADESPSMTMPDGSNRPIEGFEIAK